jgi:rhodanese-related sulfurtransferase
VDTVKTAMAALQIALLTLLAAGLTRWLRQGESTRSMREWIEDRSQFLAKLVNCPHCLSFWLAVGGTSVLVAIRGMSLLEFALFVLIGWRGAYFINRTVDGRQEAASAIPPECLQCGDSLDRQTFIERGSLAFCSPDCWFDYLRQRPIPRDQLLGAGGEILRQEIYPMSYKNVTPAEALQLLEEGESHRYVDVRSIPEFQNGHPKGSFNVPVMHREAAGMVPNPDFLTVMQVHFDQDTPLLIGCQSGVRSVRAAEALVASGFTQVTNVTGGFGGVKDQMGTVVVKGWFEEGLPVDYGDPDERSYAALHGQRQTGGGA